MNDATIQKLQEELMQGLSEDTGVPFTTPTCSREAVDTARFHGDRTAYTEVQPEVLQQQLSRQATPRPKTPLSATT